MKEKKFKDIIPVIKISLNIYEKLITNTAKQFGLNFGEAQVLLFFYDNDNLINAKDVAYKDKVSKSFVSKTIKNLVEKNYIKIIVDENDKRYQKIELNNNKINVIDKLNKTREDYKNYLVSDLSNKELDIFLKVLDKIENNIILYESRYTIW